MRKRLGLQLAAPVLAAGLLTGCGGSDDRTAYNRPAGEPVGTAGEARPADATVALSGCLEAAPGSDRFVLRNVEFAGAEGSDPQRNTTTAGAHGITEGAWVRLDAAEADLRDHLGQRVTLTGTISDSGRNTVGTSGTAGDPTPAGQPSRAAGDEDADDRVKDEAGRIARESMADGAAAEVRVTALEGSGERCQAEQRER